MKTERYLDILRKAGVSNGYIQLLKDTGLSVNKLKKAGLLPDWLKLADLENGDVDLAYFVYCKLCQFNDIEPLDHNQFIFENMRKALKNIGYNEEGYPGLIHYDDEPTIQKQITYSNSTSPLAGLSQYCGASVIPRKDFFGIS